MSVERTVAEFRDTGAISPETASWVLSVYRYELSQHGDEDRARRTVVQLLSETPDEREKRLAEARRTVQIAISKQLASRVSPPVPFTTRLFQAVLGSVAGAAMITAIAWLSVYALFALIEWIFGDYTGRVRIPVKAFLVVALAPIFGGVIGGLFGWRFNFQVAKRQFTTRLNATTVFERSLIAGSIVWSALTAILLLFFDVIDRPLVWWTDEEITRALLLWLGPIFAGYLLAQIVRWVRYGVAGNRS